MRVPPSKRGNHEILAFQGPETGLSTKSRKLLVGLTDYSLLSAQHCARNGLPSYPPYIPGAGPCLSLPPLLRSQPPATPLCRPGPENRSENSSQDCCEMQNGNLHERMFIVVVQSLSCVRLCDPRNVTHQGSLFFTISWSLLRFMSIDFPGGSDSRGSAYNTGNPGSIPGSGGSPGEGNGNPLQYSCLENPMDGGSW